MPKRYVEMKGEDLELAEQVLRDHHPELLQGDFHVVFQFVVNEDAKGLMKYPKPDKHGNVVLGKAKCYSAADRAAGCPDFLVTLLFNFWEDALDEQKRALVDHELCHCGVEETEQGDKPMSVPHEFEGFVDELKRHGPWAHQLRKAEKQLVLWRDAAGNVPTDEPDSDDDAVSRLATDPGFLKAAHDLCPSGRDGIDSVTISTPHNGKFVTLTSDTGRNIQKIRDKLLAAGAEEA